MNTLRDSLRQIVLARMATDPAHDLAHLDRVWKTARDIAEKEGGANPKVLLGASYLHDLVNLPKDAPNRAQASTLAAKAAGPILSELGFSAADITQTQHAIAAHSYSGGIPPETPEARILRDADRLDALGAIGIARCFGVSGALARPLYDPDDPFAQRRPLDDTMFALDHWPAKLLALPDGMLTDTGRTLARHRLDVMMHFAKHLGQEISADLPDDWAQT